MAIEEAKDLATLPLDELIGNLNVYEIILDIDGIASKTTKEKVKSLAFKAKVTREQTSDNSNSQGESDEDIDEEEAEPFNLLAMNFCIFFRKGGERLKKKGAYYNCGIEGHIASECRKPKENKAFIGGAWSDNEDDDEHQNDATCLMAMDSQEVVSKQSSSNINLNIIDLQKENEELLKVNKDFAKTFEKLLNEKRSLEKENSKLPSKINDL
ncbi:retrovirus-related pol polyprotein from transposon 17.6 [Tanacetum coccineum]